MTSGLSQRSTAYGDAGFARFGFCSTASDFNSCHSAAPQLASAIERGVMLAGGRPFTHASQADD